MVYKVLKFSAEWCGPCRVYKNNFVQALQFYDDTIITSNQYDVDGDEHIAKEYSVLSVPTTIVLDHKNNILGRFTGNKSVSELTQWLDGLHDDIKNSKKIK